MRRAVQKAIKQVRDTVRAYRDVWQQNPTPAWLVSELLADEVERLNAQVNKLELQLSDATFPRLDGCDLDAEQSAFTVDS